MSEKVQAGLLEKPRKSTGKRRKSTKKRSSKKDANTGKLRIGDDWNAITIIALSQSNPLKAVAEFVENSIDAGATRIAITRGKERGEPYLRIVDNGRGIPRNASGEPDFKYVATHICDSIKRQLKSQGTTGLQGEFGIGLLSFWTVGENLIMRSVSESGKTFEMAMSKGNPSYTVNQRRILFDEQGTELLIKPLLPGLRQFSGEKIQFFLASELRDRIMQKNVEITITDKQARKQFTVEPRQFPGLRLTGLTNLDDIHCELYLHEPSTDNQVSLFRSGTRVLQSITELDGFDRVPWNSPYLVGLIDAARLNLTPGTRMGVIQDEHLDHLREALQPVEEKLLEITEAQEKAEDERASQKMLKTISKAFREALIALPIEEYDWFDLGAGDLPGGHKQKTSTKGVQHQEEPLEGDDASQPNDNNTSALSPLTMEVEDTQPGESNNVSSSDGAPQLSFFESLGPLTSIRISPASTVLRTGKSRNFRLIARDHKQREIDREILCEWSISEGHGVIEKTDMAVMTFTAPEEPCLTRLTVTATEGSKILQAEALVTVTKALVNQVNSNSDTDRSRGLPAYSFEHNVGELWRSRFDQERNLIIVNSGHRDFVFSSRTKSLKLRYVCRLYAKELVLANFPGMPADQLLERMLEISLYTEEHLR